MRADRHCLREKIARIFQKYIERLSASLTQVSEDKRMEVLNEIDENIEIIVKNAATLHSMKKIKK